MPQLDIATYASQLFWLLVCFTGVLIGSIGFTLPRLDKVLEARQEQIEKQREAAKALKKQADRMQGEFEQHLAEVRKKSHDEVLKAIKSMTQEREKSKNDASLHFKERFLSAELRLADHKISMITEIQEIAASVATAIVDKILTASHQKRSVEQASAKALEEKVADES